MYIGDQPKSAREGEKERKREKRSAQFRRPTGIGCNRFNCISWKEGTSRPDPLDEIVRFEIVRESDPESGSIPPFPSLCRYDDIDTDACFIDSKK